MKHYVGLDVAMKETAICIVDDQRPVGREDLEQGVVGKLARQVVRGKGGAQLVEHDVERCGDLQRSWHQLAGPRRVPPWAGPNLLVLAERAQSAAAACARVRARSYVRPSWRP